MALTTARMAASTTPSFRRRRTVVSNGQTSPTTGGSLVAPAGTASAGQTWCITQGAIGFADGGSEDGVFKFKVSELRADADCMGEVMPVALRGCYGSELSD